MQTRKKLLAGLSGGVLLLGICVPALAATSHYNDGSVVGGSEAWTSWTQAWPAVATDFTKVSLTPGKNETELNFAWYSKASAGATPVVHFGTDKAALSAYSGAAAAADQSLTGDEAYDYNHVTVTGLKENTTYYYAVEKNGVQTDPVEYKTGSFSSVKMLFVGDPQIGASKGQPQGSDKLVPDAGAANTAARNDSFGWERTLNAAVAQNPDVSFIISAGDQVNKTGKPKEEEYAGYLNPAVLQSLPVATTIGNHDSLNPDYQYHFNNPNSTSYGATQAGGDYYYSYGPGLFIVLNTNNYNVAEHEKAIAQAVASDPDAQWRIVSIHQDIYGSGLDHSDTDGMILRTQLTPIFDKYDIDVVLQGHDHTYSRTKLLYGDGQIHGTYEFQLNDAKTDYDWENAYNTQNGAKIPLYPEASDTAGTAAHSAFQSDNACYTIESTSGNTVVDPKGVLYMTANSASGSKFYELVTAQQDYVAQRSQNWLPSYSVINLTDYAFSIDTYQITDTGAVEKIDDTFTIQKDAAAGKAMTRGAAAAALYEAAGSPAVSASASFSDVSAGSSYAAAVAWVRSQGIMTGTDAGTFAPDTPFTREQLALVLSRYAQVLGKPVSADGALLSACSDASSVSAWAADGVRYALNTGILTAVNGQLAPTVTATTADLSAGLSKLS